MLQILVIDDEKSILDIMLLALTRFGYQVETAASGREGIRKFDSGDFDLVITDMLMPGVNGGDVVQHIRNSDRKPTPIIGFSGTPWSLADNDFDIILAKPFALKDLVDAVHDLTANTSKTVAHR